MTAKQPISDPPSPSQCLAPLCPAIVPTVMLVAVLLLLGACATRDSGSTAMPVPVVPTVDLQRYMGTWFVVGAIGLALEDGAHNAVESYALNPDGTIATVFQFRQDSFDGEAETKVTTAWVESGTGNAEWRVRTLWPLKQQYLISYLEPDYSAAIVAREARDHVWILSRTPEIDEQRYQTYLARIEAMGYDMSEFSRYPHNGERPI